MKQHPSESQLATPEPQDWFLKEWMAFKGRIQADIIRELSWERGRVSKVYNGRQPYGRSDVNQLASWLGIEPYELLMPPEEATAMRSIRESALQIAAEERRAWVDAPPAAVKTGSKR